ncbi:transcriptional regulator [Streptomyces glebosus]|uniref:Transcriptional regulator n=1 Tax=Streptomyces glebosus TaxID=249580 RepID=A0A640SUG5_9ACTN|nr:helix-turn-helix transcriptional regulator [Streptomyces glebosus]GFE14668.1 transcriptional regulator [Streptomyces glebosus]GHG69491.1 transcriptional regulator [Streptomyces glebosus]
MAQRNAPTERQRRLGGELKKLRTAAGMSTESAAGLLGIDRSRLSNLEAGLRPISPERLRTLACNCDCRDEAYIDALVGMTQPSRGWWEKYRGSLPAGLLDIAEFEWHAARMRTAHTVHIPGLLQTSDHARTIFRVGVPAMPEHEIALRVAHRMERQRVLDGDDPSGYVGIVHEAALRMQFGGRAVARAQLEHLIAMSERDNVTLRVIPFEAGEFPGAGQTVVYGEGAVSQLDAVQVDSTHGPEFLHLETQLTRYRTQLDGMERVSLSPKESRDFIHAIARQL